MDMERSKARAAAPDRGGRTAGQRGHRWAIAAGAAGGRQPAEAARSGHPRTVAARYAIAAQGEPPRAFVLIGSGRVKLERIHGDRALSLGHRGPGQMVGETAVGGAALATENAIVVDEVEALSIPIGALRAQLAGDTPAPLRDGRGHRAAAPGHRGAAHRAAPPQRRGAARRLPPRGRGALGPASPGRPGADGPLHPRRDRAAHRLHPGDRHPGPRQAEARGPVRVRPAAHHPPRSRSARAAPLRGPPREHPAARRRRARPVGEGNTRRTGCAAGPPRRTPPAPASPRDKARAAPR